MGIANVSKIPEPNSRFIHLSVSLLRRARDSKVLVL